MGGLLTSSESEAAAAIDDSRTTLFELQKNAKERIRVSLCQYKGHEYVELRVWFIVGGGKCHPSRHGFMFKPSLAPQLIQGLELATRAADPQGAR